MSGPHRLIGVTLEGESLSRLSPIMEADRARAVADLEAENHFAPEKLGDGPFTLRLSIVEGRLAFDVRDTADTPIQAFGLALGPFRPLIKDYQMLIDSHVLAMEEGREARIQAIDMGRRGLHDEGARLVMERLSGKITLDHPTARKLFTLLCVLHMRGTP